MRTGLVRLLGLFLGGVLLGACGDDPTGPSGPASVRIDTRQPTLTALGDSLVPTATVLDRDGKPLPGPGASWSTSTPSVASISPGGAIVAHGVGTALITASVDRLTDTTTVTVTQRPGVVEIIVRQPTLTALGDSASLAAVVSDRNGNPIPDAPPAWESAAIERVEVTPEGIAIARANGATIVTARSGSASDTTTVLVAQRVARIHFVTRPERQLAGRSFETDIEVAVEDARGVPVTAPTEPIRLSLSPSGTLSGTTSVMPGGGVAVFSDVQIDEPGRAYRLVAEIGEVPPATSIFFDVHMALARVSAGGVHTCGVTTAGAAYCWGSNATGRLGDATTTDRDTPVRVAGEHRFATIHAGGPDTWALTAEGVPLGWGQGGGASPRVLSGNPNFRLLDTRWHTCGLTAEGRAYCWGAATSAIGAGPSSGEPLAQPTLAMGGERYVAIGSGDYFTCALDLDGAAWCAGQNFYSELGNGTTAFSPVPTAVAGGLRFTELGVGDSFACGIATDSFTYCWGRNDYGQLGDPEAGSQSRFPLVVAGGHHFSSISVGMRHVCGLEVDGAAYCWGDGSYGKLGTDPAVLSQPVPAAVAGSLRFRSISAGGHHTCGIAYDDYAYCWGSNLNGQLGVGGTGIQPTPALVDPPAL